MKVYSLDALSSNEATESCECWTVEFSHQPYCQTPYAGVPVRRQEGQPREQEVDVVQPLIQQKRSHEC